MFIILRLQNWSSQLKTKMTTKLHYFKEASKTNTIMTYNVVFS